MHPASDAGQPKTLVTAAPGGEEGAAGAGRLWKALALLISFNGSFMFSLN